MKLKLAIAAAITMVSANAAYALSSVKGSTVPEIDALSGLAALAVVGAAVALIRERSK